MQSFSLNQLESHLDHVERIYGWYRDFKDVEGVARVVTLDDIAARVKQGGHNVPRADVIRRFARGWHNFHTAYRPLADAWAVYDNSRKTPRLLERGP